MLSKSDGLGILSLLVYVIGGVGVLAGMVLIILVGDANLSGIGTGKSLGYLLVFVGAGLSILGVLLMRIVRNHIGSTATKASAK